MNKNPYKAVSWNVLSIAEMSEKDILLISNKFEEFIEKANSSFVSNFIYRYKPFDKVIRFLITKGQIIALYNEDKEIVGGCIYTIGHPWYNEKELYIEEKFSVAFHKGVGAINMIATALESLGKQLGCKMVCMANGFPFDRASYGNAMKKLEGWDSYSEFYKVLKK